MKFRQFLLASVFAACGLAQAQSCEGGMYLNPQVIRGEGSAQTESALRELIDFVRPSGLSVTPVINVKETQEVVAAVKRARPPCWVYGNPVVGLSSGYRPAAVNMDPIQAAVLILADIGSAKDAAPVELKSLPPAEQAMILARLKTTNCFGIKSGVTTALVQAQNLCGTVVEVTPQQGLGQSYLPTKAAFFWQADRWAGLITRQQTAQRSSLKSLVGLDDRIHMARLVVVPANRSSWGYGLYVHPSVSADTLKKAAGQFTAIKGPNPLLLKALDLDKDFEFATPPDAAVQEMKKTLGVAP